MVGVFQKGFVLWLELSEGRCELWSEVIYGYWVEGQGQEAKTTAFWSPRGFSKKKKKKKGGILHLESRIMVASL